MVLLSLLGLLRLFYSARVQVVSGPLVEVEPEECVRTKQFEGGEKEGATLLILNVILPTGVSTIVCIKPTESGDSQNLSDNVISKSIRDTGAWEGFNVNNVVRAVNRFPEATFLGNSLDQNVTSILLTDVGCNIGMYSLVVAAMGRQVVAVDADARNLELVRKSVELINRQSSTKLIYNSVSDGYETLYPYTVDPTNPGGTAMKTLEQVQREKLEITLVSCC